MRDYRYTTTFANFQDNFYERDEKFNYFYDIVYSILFELYDKEYNENVIETTIQNVLSNYNDGYFTYNFKSIYNIIRNTVLKYRIYKDQSFQFKPGVLSQDTFISAIQNSNYYDKGKEFYVSIAALYATLIILEDFVAFCYKNSEYTFKTSSTQYLNALTTYYQNTFNLINNTTLIASYIFGNYAINAYDTDNYLQFIQQITPINIIDNPIYVTRKNDTLILTSFTTEINSLRYTYSTTLPISNYFKLPINIPEGYYYQTNYRQLYAIFETSLFSQLNDLLYTTAYLSRSFYPDARLQQLRQNLDNEIVVSVNNNRYVLTFLDIIKAIAISYYKLIYKTMYDYDFDLENLLDYNYSNFNPEIFVNEYLYNVYGKSYTHNYLCSATNNSNTLCNLDSTRDFALFLVHTLPQELIKAINQYPEFVLINFPAYLQLINIELELANITRSIYTYLEFYLLYNVIPFRVLKYYKLINVDLPSQPISINNAFIRNNENIFKNKVTILDSLTNTKKYIDDGIITNCDTTIYNTALYCKNYGLEKNYYTYIYACSLYPPNSIELSNTFICSYTKIYNTVSDTKYNYALYNRKDCSNVAIFNDSYTLLTPNNYIPNKYFSKELYSNSTCISNTNENIDCSLIASNTTTYDLNCNNDLYGYECSSTIFVNNNYTPLLLNNYIRNIYFNQDLYNNSDCSFNVIVNDSYTLVAPNNFVCDTNIQYDLINSNECDAIINENRCYTIDLVCNNDYSILDYMKLINICGDKYICSNKDITNEYELMFN